MYCSSCGSLIKDGQSFCGNCGAPAAFPARPAPQPIPQQAPVYQQPVPQPVLQPAPQPAVQQIRPDLNMAGSNVNKVPTASKAFGWISIILSGLGIIGAVMVLIASGMPSGSSVLIQSEDAARITVFFFGMLLGCFVSFLGGVSGIISLITMLVKHNKKMIWLPITGIGLAAFAFIATIMATAELFGSVA